MEGVGGVLKAVLLEISLLNKCVGVLLNQWVLNGEVRLYCWKLSLVGIVGLIPMMMLVLEEHPDG